MTIENQLHKLINPDKNRLKGSIGLSKTMIEVSNRPGFVWVRLADNENEIIRAHNFAVTPEYNLPVIIEFDGKKYVVKGVDIDRYGVWNNTNSYMPKHGDQHSAMRGNEGADITWVDLQQFLPLLATPNGNSGSSNAWVAPYIYRNSAGNWLLAGNTGTSAFYPTSPTGSNIYLLMMNDTTGQFYSITGSVFSGALTGTWDIVSKIPTYPTDSKDIPIAAIRAVASGTVTGWDNIYNVRQLFNQGIGGTGGSTGTSSVTGAYVSISGSTMTGELGVPSIQFNLNYSGTWTEGRMAWDNTDGSLDIGMPGGTVTLNLGQELLLPRRVKNTSTGTMPNGALVYITGGDGNNAYVALAKADAEVTSATTIAMLTEDITSGQKGWATMIGLVRDVNTNSYAPGTALYLSATTAGAYTSTRPSAPNHGVYIGTVFRQHATQGIINVNIDNGFELDELHNVNITTPVDNEVLTYVSGTWQNKASTSGIVTGSIVATNFFPPLDVSNQAISGGWTHFSYSPASNTVLLLINGVIQKAEDVIVDGSGLGVTYSPGVETGSYVGIIRGATGTTITPVVGSITLGIDGHGSTPTTGMLLDFLVPYDITVNDWKMLGNVSGSVTVDLWKSTFATFPPTVANTITAANKPKLTNQFTATGTVVGWVTNWDNGDTIRVNVDSASTLTKATLLIDYTRR